MTLLTCQVLQGLKIYFFEVDAKVAKSPTLLGWLLGLVIVKPQNQDLEKNLNVIKSKSPNSELGSSIITGELFKDNPFGEKTFADSMNVLGRGNNINIEPLNKEVTDLSMKKKTKTKTVFIRQPVIVGEK